MRLGRALKGDRHHRPPFRPFTRFEPLVTAEEGFPAIEKLAWEAEESIWMAFRIFEPDTRVRSPDIPCETWLDLLREKLRQGVSVRITLTDFDPIAAPELHETTWRSAYTFGTLTDEGPIEILPIRHEARIGHGLRYGFWLLSVANLEKQRRALNAMPEDQRRETFLIRPGIWRHLRLNRAGHVWWRALRLPRLYPVTFHQKIAVFDGRLAVVGGLDINERRWDDKLHQRPAEETWHDTSVVVDGPVVQDVARHVADCWNRNLRRMGRLRRTQNRLAPVGAPRLPMPTDRLPAPDPPTDEPVERGLALVRTVSTNSKRYLRLSPVTRLMEIEDAHIRLIREAERLIFIESQFLRSQPIADALAEAARARPDLGLIMVVPAAPEQIAFDKKSGLPERLGEHLHTECIDTVKGAFGTRCAILSPVRPVASRSDGRDATHGAEIIYVHSKVIVVDDREAIVSSANLNGRSLRWDTEAGILCNVPERAADLRRRLLLHWLPDADDVFLSLDGAVAAWRELAERNAALPPPERRGFLVPHDNEAAEEIATHVPGVPHEAV